MTSEELLSFAYSMLEKIYPPNANYYPTVSLQAQEKEVNTLKEMVKYEQFFFVIDLLSKKIEHTHGIQTWLGYSEQNFTLAKYFSIIHPSNLESLNVFAQAAFQTANSQKYQVRFMEQKFVVQIPLKRQDGQYILVKRTLYPFQIDKNGMVTAYLNHFTVLKNHTSNAALEPSIREANNLQMQKAEIDLKETALKIVESSKKIGGFNKKQLTILKNIADNADLSQKEVFEQMGILRPSMVTHAQRIIEKARTKYEQAHFNSLKDVALFLRQEGLV